MRRPGPLALRLAAVMAAVAVASVVVFAAITYLVERSDIHREADTRQSDVVAAMTQVAVAAYDETAGWSSANLQPLDAIAGQDRLGYALRNTAGTVIRHEDVPGGAEQGTETVPLKRSGALIGTLTVIQARAPLPPEILTLRDALSRSVFAAGGIAAGVAFLVALAVAGWITRPIKALTVAMRRHADGDAPAAEADLSGPGELGELARAFQAMTIDLDDAARLRRGMVADLAHELRTPIAVLQAETEAMLDGVTKLTPEATVSLHEEILRLGRLVQDLQTLSSAEAAHLDLQPRPLDLAELAATAIDAQVASAREAGIVLERDLHPVAVNGDPLRLHQVTTNLLTNAIKYTPAGGQIRVAVGNDVAGALIEVADTGPGIAADILPHVFERFRRGRHGDVPGSGVGLTVVRELVEAHGGTVELLSPPTGGTRARVHLPVR